MKSHHNLTLLLGCLLASSAQADTSLSLADAERLAQSARSACTAIGREVAVAIVDAGGRSSHNLEAVRRKAFTSLSTRQSTLALGRQARSQPDTAALQYLPELLRLGGGVPLLQGSTVLGAVGAAGSGGPENETMPAQERRQRL